MTATPVPESDPPATTPRLDTGQLLDLARLVKGADSIELKLTVPEHSYRPTSSALGLDPLDAQIRQVFFFDTPDLQLDRAGLVVRARRIQGRDGDSVIKLRPIIPDEVPKKFRKSEAFSIEVDAMPGSYVCSGSMKSAALPAKDVRRVTLDERPISKLFSQEQQAMFEAYAPDGVSLDDLAVLGPIFVLKLKVTPDTFERRLVVELWLYPNGARVLELSTKCLPGEGLAVADQLRSFLGAKGLDLSGDQSTKTRTALEYFSGQLQAR